MVSVTFIGIHIHVRAHSHTETHTPAHNKEFELFLGKKTKNFHAYPEVESLIYKLNKKEITLYRCEVSLHIVKEPCKELTIQGRDH